MTETFIVGVGGLGREVLWLLRELNQQGEGYDIQGFVDDDERLHGQTICGIPVLGSLDLLESHPEANAVLGVGLPEVKQKILTRLIDLPLNWPTLVAPDVQCSGYVEIGQGAIVCSGNILTTQVDIGAFSLINLDCTIGHDVILGAGTTLSPGVHLSGQVSVGSFCNIGTGAVAIPDIDIGEHSVVGAAAVVIDDLAPGSTAVGNPAKVIKQREVPGPDVSPRVQ